MINNFIKQSICKTIVILCAGLFCLGLHAKQIFEGNVFINGKNLNAILFDDVALDPSCRGKHSNAKQAMFYLDEKLFAHGCWIFLDNEIHTQMTRYDNHEVKAYVFPLAAFKRISATSKKENSPEKSTSRSKCQELYQAWIFNVMLEEACKLKMGVAQNIGVAAKSICQKSSEAQRNQWGTEVFKVIKNDLDEMGDYEFCRRNKPEYEALAKQMTP